MTVVRPPLSILYNQRSGFHAPHREQLYACVLDLFKAYGFELQVFDLNQILDFDGLMQSLIDYHHQAEKPGMIVVAGGDGTLNTVIGKLLQSDIPIGILPLGTFNYVARALHIPLDLLEAARVILTGQDRTIHVATLNGRAYLNNASLGLYPLFIQRREQFNRYLGRFSWHAYSSALDVLLRAREQLQLSLEVNGEHYPIDTPLIFFGNNQLQLQQMNLQVAECAAKGRIAGVAVASGDKWTLLKMVWLLLRGTLEQASEIQSFCATEVTVRCKQSKLMVAIDGELAEMETPLTFGVHPHAVKIRVP